MFSPLRIVLLFSLAIAFAMPGSNTPIFGAVLGVETAQAQTSKRKSLFDILFKRREKKREKRRSTSKRRSLFELPGVRYNRRTTSNDRPSATEETRPAVVVVKNENAAKILVIGDFMASGLASGLEKLYSQNPNFVIVKNTNPASGIVRNDVVDWTSRVPDLINEVKPVAVIALVGMNDRQEMRFASGNLEKLSEAWKTEYVKRVTTVQSSGKAANVPVLWVGLPPVKSNRMNADYLAFNETFRSVSDSVGGSFVDVWDGFTNAEGKFVSAGPDINGQIVRLRGSKGIGMTRAGKTKLAFFADKELRRIGVVNSSEGFNFASLGTINPNLAQPKVPEYDPAGTGKTVVISLGSPSLDGGDVLEGEEDYPDSDTDKDSVSFELVENGLPKLPQPGRVDAQWGTPKAAPQSEPETSEGNEDTNKVSQVETTTN
ncbi:MAG: SGNH family hydrolase [Pseudomonadota bacterium]